MPELPEAEKEGITIYMQRQRVKHATVCFLLLMPTAGKRARQF